MRLRMEGFRETSKNIDIERSVDKSENHQEHLLKALVITKYNTLPVRATNQLVALDSTEKLLNRGQSFIAQFIL